MMVMEMGPAFSVLITTGSGTVSSVSLTPMTWKVETGLKVKVPGSVAEKSYRTDTVNEFSSPQVANAASSFNVQCLPLCSVVTSLPAGMILQYFSERRSVTTGTYGSRNCEYGLIDTQEIGKTGEWRVESKHEPQHR